MCKTSLCAQVIDSDYIFMNPAERSRLPDGRSRLKADFLSLPGGNQSLLVQVQIICWHDLEIVEC